MTACSLLSNLAYVVTGTHVSEEDSHPISGLAHACRFSNRMPHQRDADWPDVMACLLSL